MMDPPKVLLELSFLRAVHDIGHDQHEQAVTEYLRLVSLYQREEVLLVAVSDHVQDFPGVDNPLRQIGVRRRGVFAPVDFLWVGFQHRRAARRAAETHELDEAVALALTMAQRHRIQQVATLDPRFEQFDLTLLPARAIEPDAGDADGVITDVLDG